MGGKLYFCATPIGNLGDITLRTLEILREADLVVAEDTRHTRKLLSHFSIQKPLLSCHEHNEKARVPEILGRVAAGERVAVVSDAGTPAIQDPGARLIAGAIARNLDWTVLPGPSALLTGLLLSGLSAQPFLFLGFPPRQGAARRAWLEEMSGLPFTLVFYESPHRLLSLLEDLHHSLGERPAAIVREISKRYEQVERGSLEELVGLYGDKKPRGEFVVVVGPAPVSEPQVDAEAALAKVRRLVEGGCAATLAIREVAAEFGLARRILYNKYHNKGKIRADGLDEPNSMW